MTFNEAFRWLRDKRIGTFAVTYALTEARKTGSCKMYPYMVTFSDEMLFTIKETENPVKQELLDLLERRINETRKT